MDETEIRHVLEAALLAAQKPLTLDKLVELFSAKAPEVDKEIVRNALAALSEEYDDRGLELKEVASGFRIQIRSRMSGWLQPLWEERPPRYSRALLETLALMAYRQPITRGEIEEIRGVAVNANIIRSMLERNWIRVVGHRDVPGKPEMFGTTKEFLDYFGLRSIDQLPALAEIKEHGPEAFPQADFIEGLEANAALPDEDSGTADEGAGTEAEAATLEVAAPEAAEAADDDVTDESEIETAATDSDSDGETSNVAAADIATVEEAASMKAATETTEPV